VDLGHNSNCLLVVEEIVWVGFDELIQVRNGLDGDLIQTIPFGAVNLLYVHDTVWAYSQKTAGPVISINDVEDTTVRREISISAPLQAWIFVQDKIWIALQDGSLRLYNIQVFFSHHLIIQK
jgi:hypothetical protein